MSVSQSADAPVSSGKGLFGHPPGLTVLFLTQTWAEFSYFGLQAMLVYYMTQQLELPQAQASIIYGVYGACAFFSPLFGGIIADRWLGKTRSVVIGGLMMMCGHFAMAFESLLFPALALVALGNGLFIPPLAVQVARLYQDGDARRDQAFSAYYMGINLGGFTAPSAVRVAGRDLWLALGLCACRRRHALWASSSISACAAMCRGTKRWRRRINRRARR